MTELFIVQSVMATTARNVRDRFTQAVLSIDESIVDINAATLNDLFECEAIVSVIQVLGIGIGHDRQLGDGIDILNLNHLRYGKIVVVADDSEFGKHIRKQLLSLFFRFFHEVLAGGYIYIALEALTETEFETAVMAPASRRLKPVRVGRDLASTLRWNEAEA